MDEKSYRFFFLASTGRGIEAGRVVCWEENVYDRWNFFVRYSYIRSTRGSLKLGYYVRPSRTNRSLRESRYTSTDMKRQMYESKGFRCQQCNISPHVVTARKMLQLFVVDNRVKCILWRTKCYTFWVLAFPWRLRLSAAYRACSVFDDLD